MDNVGKNPATRYGKNVRICSTVRSKFSNTIRQDMGAQAKINLQSYQIKKVLTTQEWLQFKWNYLWIRHAFHFDGIME